MVDHCDTPADANADVKSDVNAFRDQQSTQILSEQKKVELSLVHESIFSGEGVALCMFDDSFRILNCNISFEKMTGYEKSELQQMYWYDVVEEDTDELLKMTKQNEYNAGHSLSECKCKIVQKEGKSRFVHVNLVCRPGASGNLVSVFDMTEIKKKEDILTCSKAISDALLNSPTIATAIINVDGMVIDLNEVTARRFGMAVEEMKGKNIWEFFPEQIKANRQRKAAEAFEKKCTVRFTDCRDGIYNDNVLKPITDGCLKEPLLLVSASDITPFVEAEKQKEVLLNSMKELFCFFDLDLTIRWTNKAAAESVGLSAEEMVGRQCYELWNNCDSPCDGCPVLKAKESGKAESVERMTPDGRWWQLHASPVFDGAGALRGLVELGLDITEKKRLENHLSQSHKKLLQILGSMDEVIYVSDLKTYDLLYVNAPAKKMWGKEYEGKKCYEYLQNRSNPCPFCTNHIITQNEDQSYIWEFQNEVNHHWYRCIDRVIEWVDGRQVRFELAVDINDKKMAEKQIQESEEKFKQVAENLDQVLYLYDPKADKFLFVSPSYEEVWEIPVEGVLKDPLAFTRLVHPDDKKAFDEACRLDREGSKCFNLEYRIVMPDGRVKWIWSRNFPVLGKHRTVGISEDVTLLRETQKKYRTYIDNAPEGVVVVDSEGRYVEVNQAMCDITGFSQDELLSKTIQDTAVDEGKVMVEENFNRLKKIGTSYEESIFLHKNGLKRWWTIDAVKLSENRYLGFIQDITERKRIEAEIVQKNKELSRVNQLKSNFLNVTSHELRTPMTAISGYLQMIKNNILGEVSDDQHEAIDIVLRNADRLDLLVDDILDTSRLESGTMKFLPEQTRVDELIDDVGTTMRSELESKQIGLEIKMDSSLPSLTIDPDRIKQVIINLLKNAIKFSSEHSTITMRVKDDADCVIFSVIDQGRGIPKDKQGHVFDIFYQVESGIDRSYGGTGLGLTICKGIVIGHGGEIWVESTEGVGSTFSFSLPKIPVSDVEGNFQKIDLFNLK